MATKLKVLRVEHGLSQQELAEIVGTTQRSVSSWETNRSVPRPKMMKKIADYFGKTVNDIFFDAFN